MPGKIIFGIAVSFGLCMANVPCVMAKDVPAPDVQISAIEPPAASDRLLILAPHPDDEAIACAGVIQSAVAAGSRVRIVYLTNGDHNEPAFIVYEKRLPLLTGEFIHLGEVRRQEAIAAMKLLGVDQADLTFLGYPDFGTLKMFSDYWHAQKPYKSILTRIANVPYKENLSYNAPYVADNILNDIKTVLLEYKPNKIFVSHPADVNGDHKALYLYLQVALRDLQGQLPAYTVHSYLVHCVGWPLPRRYHPELALVPPEQFQGSTIQWSQNTLTPAQVDTKYRAIMTYKSQTLSSAFYLLSFARSNELFGDYPPVSLRQAPVIANSELSFCGYSNMLSYVPFEQIEKSIGVLHKDQGKVSYCTDRDALMIKIEQQRNISRSLKFVFSLFGYRRHVPFTQMPKIMILAKGEKFQVFSGARRLPSTGISLDLQANVLTLRVPLSVLAQPDMVLSAVKVYAGIFPFEIAAFRTIELQ